MKRREFLQYSTAATLAAAGTQIVGGIPVVAQSPMAMLGSAAEENDNILIIIQMFGGNDGLNTIIPAEDDAYHKIRPSIGVKAADAQRIANSQTYMHPALVDTYNDGFLRLWDDGRLAIIQGIGYENPNLSHFRSTDIWLSGINSSDPNTRLSDGWIGRYFAHRLPDFPQVTPEHPLSVQIGGVLSLAFRSERGDTGIALTDPDKFFELGQGLSPDEEPMTGDSAFADEFNFIRTIARDSDRYSQVVKGAFDKGKNTVEYAKGFAQQLKLIARLISGGLRSKVYMVHMGGFDTHVQQQDEANNGLHPSLLNALSTGISQFMMDALQQGFANRVIGATVSEFGRRPFENGSRGTDHGAASVQFVWGNKVKGFLYGNNPNLKDLNANGDLIYQFDYRRVYAEILQTWFGASDADTLAILGEKIVPLPILQSTTGVSIPVVRGGSDGVSVFPNPSVGVSTLSFELLQPSRVEVELYGNRGTLSSVVFNGVLGVGLHTFSLSFGQSGVFYCVVKAGGHRCMLPVSVVR